MDINQIETIAKQVVEHNGGHSPQAMFVKEDIHKKRSMEIVVFEGLDMGNEKIKSKAIDLIRKRVSVGDVPTYYTIFEGWMSKKMGTRPSLDKDRREAIVISQYNKDITGKTIILPFDRDDKNKKIIWKDRDEFENKNADSRWNVYLEDCFDERWESVKRERSLKMLESEETKQMIKMATKEARKHLKDDSITEEMLEKALVDLIKHDKIVYNGDK